MLPKLFGLENHFNCMNDLSLIGRSVKFDLLADHLRFTRSSLGSTDLNFDLFLNMKYSKRVWKSITRTVIILRKWVIGTIIQLLLMQTVILWEKSAYRLWCVKSIRDWILLWTKHWSYKWSADNHLTYSNPKYKIGGNNPNSDSSSTTLL